jgi:hypothetical protein
MVNFELKYAITYTTEINCEIMVAHAAPAMPSQTKK